MSHDVREKMTQGERLLRTCQRGATAVEYGLIVVLIGLAVLGAMTVTGGGTGNLWGNVANEVTKY